MKLILFRHGIAMDRELAALQKMEDAQRPLTEKGRERTLKMARHLKSWENQVEMIVTSPLIRAQQTADILFHVMKCSDVTVCSELVPSAPPQAFAQWLKTHAKTAVRILAVGHEPHLSHFASWALTGTNQSFIEIKKSGMICLEIESLADVSSQSATLAWAVQPKLLLK
jgi:phosphohistidine phosphatase